MDKTRRHITKNASNKVLQKTSYRNKQGERSALTRKKLLEATVSIIHSSGISCLSVRSICETAGLTTGAFYHVFNSKEDVINYYLDFTFKRYKREASSSNEGLSASKKIRNLYQYTLKCYIEAGHEFMSAFYSTTNPVLNFRERPNGEFVVLEEVEAYLRQGQIDNEIRDDIDLEEVKLEIAIIVTGAMFYWCVFKGEIDVASIVDKNLSAYLATIEPNASKAEPTHP